MLKTIITTLAILLTLSTRVYADFSPLTHLPHYGAVDSFDEAVVTLFNQKPQSMKVLYTSGGQAEKTYTVRHRGKKWFVKIIREDCEDCNKIAFQSEWKIKNNYQSGHYPWLKTNSAQLIVPDKGAIFTYQNTPHLITRYSLVEGKTLEEIYEKEFDNLKKSTRLQRAIFQIRPDISPESSGPERPRDSPYQTLVAIDQTPPRRQKWQK